MLIALTLLAAALQEQSSELVGQQRGVGIENEQRAEPSRTTYFRRHALVIGIDEYTDPSYPDLGYAVADARAVAEILIEKYGFAQKSVRLILNGDATRDALANALEDWACNTDRIGDEDLFVVFFAGHGVTRELGRGDRGYLVPVDSRSGPNGGRVWSSLLGMNELEDVSEAIPAKHVLFILDCCFGGLAVSRSAPPIVAGLGNRARQVITAGNANQTVLDTGGGGHSVFTGALLEALNGSADLDNDQIITFGELYNHVGRQVERKTKQRQTPLQATLPDHEGGNVALFQPGHVPNRMSATDRLKQLEQTTEEQLIELKRLSDYILISKLERETEVLWPQAPEMVPRYRRWLSDANELLDRRSLHEESLRRLRQQTFLIQVLAGLVEEGEGTEPIWDVAEPVLQWRFETLSDLQEGLDRLEALIVKIVSRLAVASTLEQRTVSGREAQEAWAAAVRSIANAVECPQYGSLNLSPQIGFFPLGRDPRSGLWEFGDVRTGALPERNPETGELMLSESTGLVFVLVPGGTFSMGAQSTDPEGPNYAPQAGDNEGPVHAVTLDPFFLSKYEMTQGQWKVATGSNPSHWAPGRTSAHTSVITARHPVEQVSWVDCERTLTRLGFTLPSEIWWEYACRANTVTAWHTGNDVASLAGFANIADQTNAPDGLSHEAGFSDDFDIHAPVGSLKPNAFGFHDMHGNVFEWCQDEYQSYRRDRPARTSEGGVPGSRSRVVRGGSSYLVANIARSAFRYPGAPVDRDFELGLRPAAKVITE